MWNQITSDFLCWMVSISWPRCLPPFLESCQPLVPQSALNVYSAWISKFSDGFEFQHLTVQLLTSYFYWVPTSRRWWSCAYESDQYRRLIPSTGLSDLSLVKLLTFWALKSSLSMQINRVRSAKFKSSIAFCFIPFAEAEPSHPTSRIAFIVFIGQESIWLRMEYIFRWIFRRSSHSPSSEAYQHLKMLSIKEQQNRLLLFDLVDFRRFLFLSILNERFSRLENLQIEMFTKEQMNIQLVEILWISNFEAIESVEWLEISSTWVYRSLNQFGQWAILWSSNWRFGALWDQNFWFKCTGWKTQDWA